jgi:hypothetical protein
MKIDIDIPDGKSGEWKIKTFTVSEDDAKRFNITELFAFSTRTIEPGTYKKLIRGNVIVMSNTSAEIRDHSEFFWQAKGNILINGLGLGVAVKHLLTKKEVKHITVIEKSSDVIKLVASYYKDSRVSIINADAFEFQSKKGFKFDCVWHDIWDEICSDNLPEMHRLHRKYGRKAHWQGSWCRYQCERLRKHY